MSFESLTIGLIRTIGHPEHWSAVLKQLREYTKSSKALLSLRDLKTAEIIVPNDVLEKRTSPFISGFSETAVASYLTDYVEIDPWTAIERVKHPYYPYAMSQHLSLNSLKRTPFWDWLEPQGIQDCIVCEIGHTDTYWVSLTLYCDHADDIKLGIALRALRAVLPLLRAAWREGRQFQMLLAAKSALQIVLTNIEDPAVLVARNGEILVHNDAMRVCCDTWSVDIEPGKRLSLPTNVALLTEDDASIIPVDRCGTRPSKLMATATLFQSSEMTDGEPLDTFLIKLTSEASHSRDRMHEIWDDKSLTPRESELVKIITTGTKFVDAQQRMAVSYPRVMQLWKSARVKLGFQNVNELRLAYQLRQKRKDL